MRKKPFYVWENILEQSIRLEMELDDLSRLKKFGLKEENKYNKIYNYFAELCTIFLKESCDKLKKDVNFYIFMNDYQSASIPIRKFRINLNRLYFYEVYNVLKPTDKEKLRKKISSSLYDYIKALKINFEKSEIVDCVFECASCLQKLKLYEQLQ